MKFYITAIFMSDERVKTRKYGGLYFPGLTNSQSQSTTAQAMAPIPNKESPKIWGDAFKPMSREDAIIKEEIIMDTDRL